MGELETNHGVRNEGFAEGATFVCVFGGFFVADAGEAETLDDDAYTFVVEVGHDHYFDLC